MSAFFTPIAFSLSANKLASYLDEDAKRLWSQRGQMDWIILVDWKSSGENWDPAISALRGILLNVSKLFSTTTCVDAMHGNRA